MNEKDALRRKLLRKLFSLTKEEIKRRSENVEKNIVNLQIYKKAKLIMVYYPLKGEPNFLGMIRKDLGKKRFCFPVIDVKNKNLTPYSIRDLKNDFVKGPCGVMQPDVRKAKKVDREEIDVVFVPGLAFDRNKYRLGRGGGFYDRFVKGLNRHTEKIGVAFDFQILKNLPVYIPHDQKIDAIVTDTVLL